MRHDVRIGSRTIAQPRRQPERKADADRDGLAVQRPPP